MSQLLFCVFIRLPASTALDNMSELCVIQQILSSFSRVRAVSQVFPSRVCAVSQVNVIHTASPVEHVNNAMMQPQFTNPMQHASVDLTGHSLLNARQTSGTRNHGNAQPRQRVTTAPPQKSRFFYMALMHSTTSANGSSLWRVFSVLRASE